MLKHHLHPTHKQRLRFQNYLLFWHKSITCPKNIPKKFLIFLKNKISTNYALINITDNIKQALDDGYIDCGIFVDLQKVFETVEHFSGKT